MTEPTGYEYVLESTQQRSTSVVVRGAGHLCTLIQKTPLGVSVVDLSESAKAVLLELLGAPVKPTPMANNMQGMNQFEQWRITDADRDFIHNQTYANVANALPEQTFVAESFVPDQKWEKVRAKAREEAVEPKRKPGRPPKSSGEAA